MSSILKLHSCSGKDFYFIPEFDEEVLVSFVGSNAQNPFVLGMQYNGSELCEYLDGENKVRQFILFTRLKSLLMVVKEVF